MVLTIIKPARAPLNGKSLCPKKLSGKGVTAPFLTTRRASLFGKGEKELLSDWALLGYACRPAPRGE